MSDRSLKALNGLRYGPAPEASEDVNAWLDRHGRKFAHFIDRKFCSPGAGEYREVLNPANGGAIAWVARGNEADVDVALDSARRGAEIWSGHSCQQRYEVLYSIYRNLNKHSRLFARLESMNNGKPIWQSRDLDVPLAIRHFRHHAGWAKVRDQQFPGYRPGGVVAQIVPWNFPLLMLAWKIAPALAAGNSVVIKPAETTPLTAMLFANILQETGLPPGVVNIVNGAGPTGRMLVEKMVERRRSDSAFWKVAFTGSTDVGRQIRAATAGSGLRLSLELGGKSPYIIFDSADIDSAVRHLVYFAIMLNYGQVCCAGSRLLVQESVYDKVITKVKEEIAKLRGGNPMDKCMDLGAVNSKEQRDKINQMIQCGRDERADVWQPEGWNCPSEGFHCKPTLVTGVQTTSRLVQEEIFGPVLVAMSFRTPKEAAELANNTVYGLAASVWTEDASIMRQMNSQLKAGVIWNNCTNLFDAASGFGGVKESGFGREGGREGMLEYLVEKHPVRWGSDPDEDLIPSGRGDRTYRLWIGGKLVRPDEGQSFSVYNDRKDLLGVVSDSNRKDVRNAVVAARKSLASWDNSDLRSSVLYFIFENMLAHHRWQYPAKELEASVQRIAHWGAMADKFGGTVQSVPGRFNVQGIREPIGVIGIRAPDSPPLLGLTSLLGAALAMGNSVVLIAGSKPMAAAEFIQVLENSDLPPGVVNLLTAKDPDARILDLAKHRDVDAVWCFGSQLSAKAVEEASVGNMKRTWCVSDEEFDWFGPQGESEEFLRQATQVKNVWSPAF